ncbi:MAG: DUF4384 domain-containing protein [Candidatus Contendobacter sp.]|nr:DUF4384 domain-containing protein [Candidatus Contendobacter sp.]MDG4557401.1 DUF4384 domain-containing protein [Candidatus Contendobacter sp.]
MEKKYSWGFMAVGMLVLTGCMTTPPEQAYSLAQPQTAPARNLTNMDAALTCMDRLLGQKTVAPIYLTSPGLPSRAGDKVTLRSGQDMLRNAVSQISRINNVFRFVELAHLAPAAQSVQDVTDTKPFDPGAIQKWIGQLQQMYPKGTAPKSFVFPDWVIAGSVSQLDDSVVSETQGGGLDLSGGSFGGSLGGSRDRILSVVTVDLYLYDWDTLQMRNGGAVANSMTVTRSSSAGDLGGRVKKSGVYLDFSYERSEGLHQAVRTLIQLSLIEMLGQLAGVPYEQCLQLKSTQASTQTKTAEDYDRASESERIQAVQDGLGRTLKPGTDAPYYSGPVTGQDDPATRRATAEYQRDASVIPSGEPDLATHRKLREPAPVKPLQLMLDTPRGRNPIYRRGEKLNFQMTVDQPAEVHCFIRNLQNEVRPLFPNLNQPDARLGAGAGIMVPGPNPAFEITFDKAGVEQIGCVASPAVLASPWPFALDVLRASPLPIGRLEELEVGYRQRTQGPVTLKIMTITVR